MNKVKIHITLGAGVTLVSLLILLASIGPLLAPHAPDYQQRVYSEEVDGKLLTVAPPIPPFMVYSHFLGTDKWGYDLLTLLLYGAKYTIFLSMLIAFLRVAMGAVIGFYLGMAKRTPQWWLAVENCWSFIPVFIPVVFLLGPISLRSPFSPHTLIGIFVAVATIVGIPGIVSTIREKTAKVKEAPYILASISLGASKNRLIFKHIFPGLREEIIHLIVVEIASVISLMGVLGIFHVYIGGTQVGGSFSSPIYKSITHEWAGLLGDARGNVWGRQWILFVPLAAIALAAFSFNLLAKGLRDRSRMIHHRTPYI
jgi:peptide/nickel transport system permease protein